MSALLFVHALLAIGCLVGWRVERARTRGWRIEAGEPTPAWVKRLHAVGEGPWVLLGTSQEGSFEKVSANPEVESEGFELRDENGAVTSVPKGTKIQLRAIDGARRKPLDAITTGGVVKPRFTFEVPPDKALFTIETPERRAMTPYRGGRLPVLGGGEKPVLLVGEPVALVGSAFPGCWLLLLFSCVGVGGALALLGMTEGSWALAGVAAFLSFAGWAALPEKPPAHLPPRTD